MKECTSNSPKNLQQTEPAENTKENSAPNIPQDVKSKIGEIAVFFSPAGGEASIAMEKFILQILLFVRNKDSEFQAYRDAKDKLNTSFQQALVKYGKRHLLLLEQGFYPLPRTLLKKLSRNYHQMLTFLEEKDYLVLAKPHHLPPEGKGSCSYYQVNLPRLPEVFYDLEQLRKQALVEIGEGNTFEWKLRIMRVCRLNGLKSEETAKFLFHILEKTGKDTMKYDTLRNAVIYEYKKNHCEHLIGAVAKDA